MSAQRLILEIAQNLEKDLLMEVSSLLNVSPESFTLKKLDKRFYLLEVSSKANILHLKFSVIAKNVYRILKSHKDVKSLLASVKPEERFYLEVYPRNKLNKKDLALLWEQIHEIRGSIENPTKVYYLFNFQDEVYLAEHLFETQRRACLLRGPKYRPFKRSGILNSELARLMVNIAKVLPGTSILDPFCGSGSILIEAYYNGAQRILGIDIDSRMLQGAKENLRFLGIPETRVQLIRGDCRKILRSLDSESFDAIVTDPPYGRSTKASDEIPKLLLECFSLALKLLRPGGRLVFVVPKEMNLSWILPPEAKVIYLSDFYVHKSLTRRLVVVEK
jgi:putative methyltransferase (TIGR01177 family)